MGQAMITSVDTVYRICQTNLQIDIKKIKIVSVRNILRYILVFEDDQAGNVGDN